MWRDHHSEGAQETWKFIRKLLAFDLRVGPIDKGAAGYGTFSLQCPGNITEIINFQVGWWMLQGGDVLGRTYGLITFF